MTDKHDFEAGFWADCVNTYSEETKQFEYARRMGLKRIGYMFDLQGAAVLDVGGGPVSLLLKCFNFPRAMVIDPIEYPEWTRQRYAAHGIPTFQMRGEDYEAIDTWDECWIYNVLQHVDNPELVLSRAREACRLLRVFEWINVPPHEGHPHELTAEKLRDWTRSRGETDFISRGGCYGECWHSVAQGLVR